MHSFVGKIDLCRFYQFENANFAFKNCLAMNIRKLTSSVNTHWLQLYAWRCHNLKLRWITFEYMNYAWSFLHERQNPKPMMLLVAIYFSTIHFRVTTLLGVFIIISFKVKPTRLLLSYIDYKMRFYMLSKIGCLQEHTYCNEQQEPIFNNTSTKSNFTEQYILS